MAYQFITLSQFISEVSDVLDDPGQVYWPYEEIQFATYEALLYWGALTSYWRERGTFAASPYPQQFSGPALPSPYFDLSVQLPTLRTRTYTLNQMVKEIQYMLMEPAVGISGVGMSGQVTISGILSAINDARNRFVLDTHLPLSYHSNFAPAVPQDGLVTFPQTSVFVHRATWLDIPGNVYSALWRQDAWAVDKNNQTWTLEPGMPAEYSEAELSPLTLQLVPPPINEGRLDALTVDSVKLDLTNPNTLFQVPDEWAHAIKYAALSQILSSAGQITDATRADYAEKRYQQSVDFAREAKSVLRLLVNNVPVPIDAITNVDLGYPTWMNQYGAPFVAGVLYDFIALVPGLLDSTYGVGVDVARTAPLPKSNDYMPVGEEELDNLKDYIGHILTFKCGGKDFTSTIGGYDQYMRHAARRKGVNAAKIQYLEPLFNQPQREWGMRPDRVEKET